MDTDPDLTFHIDADPDLHSIYDLLYTSFSQSNLQFKLFFFFTLEVKKFLRLDPDLCHAELQIWIHNTVSIRSTVFQYPIPDLWPMR
jgi:hypothetical protein